MKDKREDVMLLGLEEAGRRLGLTPATVRYLADAGEIPVIRDSARRRLFFPPMYNNTRSNGGYGRQRRERGAHDPAQI